MSLRARLSWLFPLLTLSVGCVSEPPESSGGDRNVRDNPHVGGLPEGPLANNNLVTDGGVADGGSDAVTVSAQMRYFTASGVEARPGQLTSAPQILVPQADGTFVTYNGTSDGAGGYVFSNVPQGTYYLKNGSGYIVTDSRTVDVGYDLLGRADAVRIPGLYQAQLQFNVSNLSPWDSRGTFQMASGEVDMSGSIYSMTAPPALGATTFAGTELMDSFVGEVPRFEAARGDRAWVNQVSTLDAGTLADGGTLTYTAVTRGIQLPAFSYDGTTPIPVTGAMQVSPRTEFPFEWRVSSFLAQGTVTHPQAQPSGTTLYVMPAAHGLSQGWIGYSGELLTLNLPTGHTEDLVRRVSFGNPYPSTWGVVGEVYHSYRVPVQVPGYASSYTYGSITQMERLESMIASPISVRLSPPRDLMLDGVSAYTPRMVGSVSPVLSWRPPEIGSATAGYAIRLYRYAPSSTTSTTLRRTRVASFYVGPSTTQLRLPPGILEPARNYTLEVSAISVQGDVTRTPYRLNQVPQYRANATTSVFTTP